MGPAVGKLKGTRADLAKRGAGQGKMGQGRADLSDSALGRKALLGTLLLHSVRIRGERQPVVPMLGDSVLNVSMRSIKRMTEPTAVSEPAGWDRALGRASVTHPR